MFHTKFENQNLNSVNNLQNPKSILKEPKNNSSFQLNETYDSQNSTKRNSFINNDISYTNLLNSNNLNINNNPNESQDIIKRKSTINSLNIDAYNELKHSILESEKRMKNE